MSKGLPSLRERSPQPVRSPSPDITGKSMLVSTRSPNSQQIAEMAGVQSLQSPSNQPTTLQRTLRGPRQSVPVVMQRAFASVPVTGGQPEVAQLMQQLSNREAEIEQLRKGKELQARIQVHVSAQPQTQITSVSPQPKPQLRTPTRNTSTTPTKKLSLVRHSNDDLRDRVKTLTQQNSQLKHRTKMEEISRLKSRVRDLQLENDELKRELARNHVMEVNRENKHMIEILRNASPEKITDGDRAKATVQKVKADLERGLDDVRIRMSNKLHELQQRVLAVSRKQAQIVHKKDPQLQNTLNLMRRQLQAKNIQIIKIQTLQAQLRNQLVSLNTSNQRLRNELITKELQVTSLSQMVASLRLQDPSDVQRLQSDNKMLRETLEALRQSHTEMMGQLERTRREIRELRETPQTGVMPVFSPSDSDRLKEILQLRSELGRVKALNQILSRDKNDLVLSSRIFQEKKQALSKEQEKPSERVISQSRHFREIGTGEQFDMRQSMMSRSAQLRWQLQKKRLTDELALTQQDLQKERERSAFRDRDYQNLKSTLQRVNAQILQVPVLKEQIQELRDSGAKEKQDSEKTRRQVEHSSLQITLLRSQKEALEKELRRRDQELADLRRPRRSNEFQTILRELNQLRYELDRLNTEPLRIQIKEKNERLQALIADKSEQLKSIQMGQEELQIVLKDKSVLQLKVLEIGSQLASEKAQNGRNKAAIKALNEDKETFAKEIAQLKELINQYLKTPKMTTPKKPNADTQRQTNLLSQQSLKVANSQSIAVVQLNSLKTSLKGAVVRVDGISQKIIQQLAQPR